MQIRRGRIAGKINETTRVFSFRSEYYPESGRGKFGIKGTGDDGGEDVSIAGMAG